MAMHDPPPGYDDCLFDAEHTPDPPSRYRPLEVPGVGTVSARAPLPHSVAVLGAATRAKIPRTARVDSLTAFLLMHLADGEHERLLIGMACGELPDDTIARVHRAIATWGTARPTVPSSR